jgi:hypothetical protein
MPILDELRDLPADPKASRTETRGSGRWAETVTPPETFPMSSGEQVLAVRYFLAATCQGPLGHARRRLRSEPVFAHSLRGCLALVQLVQTIGPC